VWQVTPFVFLVLYAGLQAMPREPLESATIDGANTRQQIWHIVIPALRPLFIFVIMINLMDGYRVFDSVYVMTKGGPGSATESLMFYNYQVAFAQGILGRGSAISVLTIIGIFVVLLPFLVRTYKEQTQAQ
jgi:ABC-type sugar transport system permease subunit